LSKALSFWGGARTGSVTEVEPLVGGEDREQLHTARDVVSRAEHEALERAERLQQEAEQLLRVATERGAEIEERIRAKVQEEIDFLRAEAAAAVERAERAEERARHLEAELVRRAEGEGATEVYAGGPDEGVEVLVSRMQSEAAALSQALTAVAEEVKNRAHELLRASRAEAEAEAARILDGARSEAEQLTQEANSWHEEVQRARQELEALQESLAQRQAQLDSELEAAQANRAALEAAQREAEAVAQEAARRLEEAKATLEAALRDAEEKLSAAEAERQAAASKRAEADRLLSEAAEAWAKAAAEKRQAELATAEITRLRHFADELQGRLAGIFAGEPPAEEQARQEGNAWEQGGDH